MFSLCHNSKDDEQKEEAIVNASLSNYLQGNVSSSPKSDLPIASDWNFLSKFLCSILVKLLMRFCEFMLNL